MRPQANDCLISIVGMIHDAKLNFDSACIEACQFNCMLILMRRILALISDDVDKQHLQLSYAQSPAGLFAKISNIPQ